MCIRDSRRTDRFGGSLENRSRLSVLVLKALREACGPDFLLECRVSGSEHVPDGYSLEDICGYCKYLSEYADLIHVSAGLYQDPSGTWQESTLYEPHACNADIAAAIKAAVDIPVVAIGGISHDNILELKNCGLDGVAVVSALFAQADVKAAAEELLRLSEEIAR